MKNEDDKTPSNKLNPFTVEIPYTLEDLIQLFRERMLPVYLPHALKKGIFRIGDRTDDPEEVQLLFDKELETIEKWAPEGFDVVRRWYSDQVRDLNSLEEYWEYSGGDVLDGSWDFCSYLLSAVNENHAFEDMVRETDLGELVWGIGDPNHPHRKLTKQEWKDKVTQIAEASDEELDEHWEDMTSD